jgi:hypothetical protein
MVDTRAGRVPHPDRDPTDGHVVGHREVSLPGRARPKRRVPRHQRGAGRLARLPSDRRQRPRPYNGKEHPAVAGATRTPIIRPSLTTTSRPQPLVHSRYADSDPLFNAGPLEPVVHLDADPFRPASPGPKELRTRCRRGRALDRTHGGRRGRPATLRASGRVRAGDAHLALRCAASGSRSHPA